MRFLERYSTALLQKTNPALANRPAKTKSPPKQGLLGTRATKSVALSDAAKRDCQGRGAGTLLWLVVGIARNGEPVYEAGWHHRLPDGRFGR